MSEPARPGAVSLLDDWGDEFRELDPVHRRGLSAYKTLPRAASMANLNSFETSIDSPASQLPTSSSSPFLQLLLPQCSPRANSRNPQPSSSRMSFTSRRESEPIPLRISPTNAPLTTPHRVSREGSLGSRPNSRTLFPLLSPQALSLSRPSFQDMFPFSSTSAAPPPPPIVTSQPQRPQLPSSASMASLNTSASSSKSPLTTALPKSGSLDSEDWNEVDDHITTLPRPSSASMKMSTMNVNVLKKFVEADEDYGDMDLDLKKSSNGI